MWNNLIQKVPMDKWAIRPAPPDPRDYPFAVKVQPFLVIDGKRPRKIGRYRLFMRDQGQFGSCGGQALANALDLRYGKKMSALFGYKYATEIDPFENDEGTDIRSLMKVAKDIGVCIEELYPYSAYKTALQFPDITDEAKANAAEHRIEGYAKCITKEELLTAIWKYRSVVCGVLVATNFYEPEISSAGAFLDIPEGFIMGGHAIDLIGYDEDLEYTYKNGKTYKGFCLMANSWGPEWGDNGCAWIPFDFIFGKLIDMNMPYAWDMFVPIEEFPYVEENKWLTMDTMPVISADNRVLIPIRFVAEAFGALVNWLPQEKQVSIEMDGIKVDMWVGSKEYRIIRGAK